jgi:hypothetical protein
MPEEKVLPQSTSAEQAALGAMLLSREASEKAMALLKADDFYHAGHQLTFLAIADLVGESASIDIITVTERLRQRGQLDTTGGAAYLMTLMENCPASANIGSYCSIVKSMSVQRRGLALSQSMNEALWRQNGNLTDFLRAERDKLEKLEKESEGGSRLREEPMGFFSLADFMAADFPPLEYILFTLPRAQVGQLVSVTNVGKTTLLLNACLCVAAGVPYPPLVEGAKPYRVLYLDFESTKEELQSWMKKMASAFDFKSAQDNFMLVVRPRWGNELLTLSTKEGRDYIIERAKEFTADLVVVDTISKAFPNLLNENDNAEVRRKVVMPCFSLAEATNAAVLFSHHHGKGVEGEPAHFGRGASAFGGDTRATYTLEKDETKGRGYVRLISGKAKGEMFEDTLFRLNYSTGWFERCADAPTPRPNSLTATQIAEYVRNFGSFGEVKTGDIVAEWRGLHSERTVKSRIADAEAMGLIQRGSRQGTWVECVHPISEKF